MPGYDKGSFKDPEGRVFYAGGRVFRTLSTSALARMRRLTRSGDLQALMDTGLLLPCRLVPFGETGLTQSEVGAEVMEHVPINVQTYPYEWSFTMLRDAAVLTLDLLEACLDRNLILKDATPYNIVFFEGGFSFIDILSLDDYNENQPWEGYGQFCREFLFPLMLTAYKKVDFRPWFRGTLTGIDVTDLDRILGFRDYWRKGVLKHVRLQAHFEHSFGRKDIAIRQSFDRIKYSKEIFRHNIQNLRDIIDSLQYDQRGSEWLFYSEEHSYSERGEQVKRAFVQDNMKKIGGTKLFDIGCNTGTFSFLAAEEMDCVIALDSDPACIDAVYKGVRNGGNTRVVPLVADLLNPSPPLGWALNERKGLFERVKSDGFLALAVIHHLCIGGNVPMRYFASALYELGNGGVVEWVEKSDPMVQRLLRNRTDIFEEYSWEGFLSSMTQYFDLGGVESCGSPTRKMCLFVQKK